MARAMPHPAPVTFPDHPVVVRVWRGDDVESQHRGAWALVDPDGNVLEHAGDVHRPITTRSAVKCLQALPLLETGAADAWSMDEREVALAISSHNAEEQHTSAVQGLLRRLDLGPEHLQCGVQAPGDPGARRRLEELGEAPSALHNNCSGKHAGFLALTRHLGADPAGYLDPAGPAQTRVRRAVAEMADLPEDALTWAVDGCSAPTWRLPLRALGRAFARVADPASLGGAREAACRRMVDAVAQHPELIAGRHRRLCTALSQATRGRLFPKIGAEAVYAVADVQQGLALAVKIDDGGQRALHPLVLALLERFGWLDDTARAELASWTDPVLKNWAGREVGRVEVCA